MKIKKIYKHQHKSRKINTNHTKSTSINKKQHNSINKQRDMEYSKYVFQSGLIFQLWASPHKRPKGTFWSIIFNDRLHQILCARKCPRASCGVMPTGRLNGNVLEFARLFDFIVLFTETQINRLCLPECISPQTQERKIKMPIKQFSGHAQNPHLEPTPLELSIRVVVLGNVANLSLQFVHLKTVDLGLDLELVLGLKHSRS